MSVEGKNIMIEIVSMGLRPIPLRAEFCLRRQTASCILSTSKYFQYLKTLALAAG
jgi:hypothetical protein